MAISRWAKRMPHTVTYATVASRDAYGKITFSAGVTYPARVVYAQVRTVNRSNGQDTIGVGEVWLGAAILPSMDARLTLPDGSTPIILNWDTFPDEDGNHHTKIYFGPTTSGAIR